MLSTLIHPHIKANPAQVDVKIPSDIAPGDYLLRAEVIALHVAGGLNGAQFYPSCYQITVTGGGSANPSGVLLPGAYKNTDPGILVDIHQKLSSYIDPGPTVYAGGVSKTPGASKCTGQAASIGPGGKPAPGVSINTYLDMRRSLTWFCRHYTPLAPAKHRPLPPFPPALRSGQLSQPPLPDLPRRLLTPRQAVAAPLRNTVNVAARTTTVALIAL